MPQNQSSEEHQAFAVSRVGKVGAKFPALAHLALKAHCSAPESCVTY